WCREVKRLLRPNGSFFLNIGAAPSNPMLPHEVVLSLRDEFVLQNTFHWIKSITVETRVGEEISVGHFKPISSKRFVTDCHEYIFHLTKHGDQEPRESTTASGDVSGSTRGTLHQAARPLLGTDGARSVPRHRQRRRRCATLWCRTVHRHRDR